MIVNWFYFVLGKKYYYNTKTAESVWEKPKELIEFEQRRPGAGGVPPTMPLATPMSAAPVLIKDAETVTKIETPKTAPVVKNALPVVATPASTPAPEKAKPQDKSRPVSSTPVTGTPW